MCKFITPKAEGKKQSAMDFHFMKRGRSISIQHSQVFIPADEILEGITEIRGRAWQLGIRQTFR